MEAIQKSKISVIVPCRNEGDYIAGWLKSLAAQDYPKDDLEVIIADGQSDDGTRDVIAEFAATHRWVKMIDNPEKITPVALNLALKQATGEIIIRMDVHCEFPGNYISELVKQLDVQRADNVGGVWITLPGSPTTMARVIACATSHPFGIGNARYRLGGTKAVETDTVPYGCYRKSVFERIGLFDTDLIRNQDDEFNARLIKNGGRIVLIPWVKIRYFARPNLTSMARMFYQYGYYKPLVNRKTGRAATVRQFFPPLFVLVLIASFIGMLVWKPLVFVLPGILLIYLLLSIVFGFGLRRRFKHYTPVYLFPPVFLAIHLSYGWGYIKGWLRFSRYTGRRPKQNSV